MRIALTLVLIDVGLSQPAEALKCLADDFVEALNVYERAYVRNDSGPRAFDVRRAFPASGLDESELINDVDDTFPLYAIACTDDVDGSSAVEALIELERTCVARGIPYKGGVAVAGGRLVAPCARGPRMGRMRRRYSEAIDRLVLAVRSGCAVRQLLDPRTFPKRDAVEKTDVRGSSNTILATCPVPAFAYDMAARFFEKRMTR